MTTATQPRNARETIIELIAGETVPWSTVQIEGPELFRFCLDEGMAGLAYHRLRDAAPDWPQQIRDDFQHHAQAEAATEMLRKRELTEVLDALGASGVRPVLFKGASLAYLNYDAPDLRPRNDTDLLVRRDQVESVRALLEQREYRQPVYCDGELLFCQFEMQRTDDFGVLHALDVHWKVSMQTVFADLLTYDELLGDASAIPALGTNARGAGRVHALLLACVHPAMHHRNIDRLIWLYDIHLLASGLTTTEWNRFTDTAIARGVAAICAHELGSAQEKIGTEVPEDVLQRLTAVGTSEPATAYLAPDRHWHDELAANVRGLKSWRDRARLLREVAFPSAGYMLKSYNLPVGILSRVLLPLLYAHRGIAGVMKVLRGRK